MIILYFDPSAWIKRYFQETGSEAVAELFRTVEAAACCHLGLIEMTATVARKCRAESIDAETTQQLLQNVRDDFAAFDVTAINTALIEAATELAVKHCLRTVDAIHLASALHLRSNAATVVLVTADLELLAAAR